MSNERMEFYDNEDNERQLLTLDQFVAIFCLELELNYVISTEFNENSDIIFKEINKSLYNLSTNSVLMKWDITIILILVVQQNMTDLAT
jgi:hypothetical protein